MRTANGRAVILGMCVGLLAMLPLTSQAAAYQTPNTGVTWTLTDVVENSGGVVTFNEAENRYEATDTLVVAFNDSLVIDADYHAMLFGKKDIIVNGALKVIGTDADSVFFTGEVADDTEDANDGFGGIDVDGGRIWVDRAVFVGQGSDNAETAIRIHSDDAYGEVSNSRMTGWMGYAVCTINARAVLRNLDVIENMEYGVYITMGGTLDVINCRFYRNNLNKWYKKFPAISAGSQGTNYLNVDSCYVYGADDRNLAGGVSVQDILGGAELFLTLKNTEIESCSYGINLGGHSTAHVTNCKIHDNKINTSAATGSGIAVYGTADLEMSYTEIYNNYWGISMPNGSGNVANPDLVMLGSQTPQSVYQEGFNKIYDNNAPDSAPFNGALNNICAQLPVGTMNIDAYNNYWGTTVPAEIEVGFVNYDAANPNSLVINYDPFWDGVYGPVVDSYEPANTEYSTEVGETVTFAVVASDRDTEAENLTYSIKLGEEEVATTASTEITFDEAGQFNVTATVTDDQEKSVSISWVVTVAQPNRAPEITAFQPTETALTYTVGGEAIAFSVTATDADEDELTYEYKIGEDVVSSEATASLTFTAEQVGDVTVIATVSDPDGLNATQSWTVTVSPASAAGETSAIPTEFAMNNYPNPFNAQMNINFALPQASDVKVQIYSIDGRLVESMNMGTMAAGNHITTWNATNMASGIYFVRFNAGSWNSVRKVTLVR